MLVDARKFAVKAHGEQKYGLAPYVKHLDEVAMIVRQFGLEAITIAYLHDIIEDTAVCHNNLVKVFGTNIADCVELISDGNEPSREERKQNMNKRLSMATEELSLALIVKAADRLANIKASKSNNSIKLEMYTKEHRQFKLAVYRKGLCESIWQNIEMELGNKQPHKLPKKKIKI